MCTCQSSGERTNLIVVVRVDVRLVRENEQFDERGEHAVRVEQNGGRVVLPAVERGPVVELDDDHRERHNQRAEARHDARLCVVRLNTCMRYAYEYEV